MSDWELNFRMLKAASKDAEKLPNEIKVDCYKVSLVPVKAAIDEHMKKLQDALVASLRRKVRESRGGWGGWGCVCGCAVCRACEH